MSLRDLDSKKLRTLIVLVWGIMFIFNLIIVINNPTSFGWFMSGLMLGGVFIMLLNHPFINHQDRFIKYLMKVTKEYGERIQELCEKLYSPPRNSTKQRKVKGGKKKK